MLIYAAIVMAVILRFVLPRWQKAPPNRFIALMFKPRGVDTPAAGVVLARGEYLRAARISALTAVGLALLTWLDEFAEERTLNGSMPNMLASGALLIGAIGFVMAVVMVVTHLVQAARAKPISERIDA
jgi:hypothetical protein